MVIVIGPQVWVLYILVKHTLRVEIGAFDSYNRPHNSRKISRAIVI
jgi:hypothetical protein